MTSRPGRSRRRRCDESATFHRRRRIAAFAAVNGAVALIGLDIVVADRWFALHHPIALGGALLIAVPTVRRSAPSNPLMTMYAIAVWVEALSAYLAAYQAGTNAHAPWELVVPLAVIAVVGCGTAALIVHLLRRDGIRHLVRIGRRGRDD